MQHVCTIGETGQAPLALDLHLSLLKQWVLNGAWLRKGLGLRALVTHAERRRQR